MADNESVIYYRYYKKRSTRHTHPEKHTHTKICMFRVVSVCMSVVCVLCAAREHQKRVASQASPPASAELLPRVSGKHSSTLHISVYVTAVAVAAQEVLNTERYHFLSSCGVFHSEERPPPSFL